MNKSILNEDAKQDWLNIVKKHKKKQKGLPALSKLNTNAGNVEYNISMLNKMNNPVENPSNNPVSGPFGEATCCSESLKEIKVTDTVPLNYKDLDFTTYGEQRDADDWDEEDIVMHWTYEVNKDDLYTFIYESCIDETDYPLAFEDNFDPNNSTDWNKFENWLDANFDMIYNKYQEKIFDNWIEDARNNASVEYDSYSYIDFDLFPRSYDDYQESKQNITEKLDDNFDMSMRTLL